MDKLVRKYQEPIRYILFGICTTIVNIGIFFLFDTIWDIPYLMANAISIVVAVLFAFLVNKRYVFRTKSSNLSDTFREFLLFCSFRLISGLYDMVSMWLLVEHIEIGTTQAKILTEVMIVILNYLFSKFVVFHKRS
jgi:putative flippase GtrA